MVKYAPRKVYIRESGGYVELSYTEFCRCRESDQTYMDKLFIPIQGCTECEMSAPGEYDIDIEADDINVTDTATVIWEIA